MSAGGRLDSVARYYNTRHGYSGRQALDPTITAGRLVRHARPLASMTSTGACKSSGDERDGALIAITK